MYGVKAVYEVTASMTEGAVQKKNPPTVIASK